MRCPMGRSWPRGADPHPAGGRRLERRGAEVDRMIAFDAPEAAIAAAGGTTERHGPTKRANGEDPRPTLRDNTESALIAVRLDPAPIHLIPPRPWAYGRFLLFGSAGV